MFAVVSVEPSKRKGIFNKRTSVVVTKQKGFYYVTVKGNKKPKKRVNRVLLGLDAPVLALEETLIPEYYGIRICNDREYRVRLLANAVGRLGLATVVLSDRFGEYSDCLFTLLQNCRTVHVLTENPAAYATVNLKVFNELGTSATISEKAPEKQFSVMFSPFNDSSRISANAVMLAGQGGFEVNDSDIELPIEIESLVPDGCSKVSFAAAYWRYCNEEKLISLIPNSLSNKLTGGRVYVKNRNKVF